jgi:hypothetical protein
MAASTRRKPPGYPRQVNLTLDESGANVLLESEILHREMVLEKEEPIIDGRDVSGNTHPAVNRAILWAQEQGYDVAVVLW